MKKMLVWSMLFLAWGGVVSCSDDDNALRPVSMAVGLPTGEGSDVALDELTSFDYLVWNSTTGELVPIEGAEQGVATDKNQQEGKKDQVAFHVICLVSNKPVTP